MRIVLCLLIFLIHGSFQVQAANAMPTEKKDRLLLITGCARSGTLFTAYFFNLSGLPVEHEREGEMGTVSWTMAVDDTTTPWGPGSLGYNFKHIFHQVRDPLKTISACVSEPKSSWRFICKHIGEITMQDSPVVKSAKYWYYWNLEAEKKAEFRYRIEDIENVLNEMSHRLGIPLSLDVLVRIPRDTNHKPRKITYTWSDLKIMLDSALYENIVDMAKRYGYDVEE